MKTTPEVLLPMATRIIWGAILVAPVIYVTASWFANAQKESGPWFTPLTGALVLMALASVVMGIFIPDRTMNEQIVTGRQALTAPEIYQTAMIVRWAAFEAVSVIGFVASFTCYSVLPTVIGAVISIALVASSPPRQEDLERVQEKLNRVRA